MKLILIYIMDETYAYLDEKSPQKTKQIKTCGRFGLMPNLSSPKL
jgi:hypothetical protein